MDREARNLLEAINKNGEMPAKDLLGIVSRRNNDYRDFFLAANMMHAGYFDFDAGSEEHTNALGVTSQETAIIFAQIMLPKGKSFEINGCPRDSWHDYPVKAFSTAKGFLKLEEIFEEEKRDTRARSVKRKDYFMAIITGVIVAIVASLLFHYFALDRSGRITPNNQLRLDTPKNSAPVS